MEHFWKITAETGLLMPSKPLQPNTWVNQSPKRKKRNCRPETWPTINRKSFLPLVKDLYDHRAAYSERMADSEETVVTTRPTARHIDDYPAEGDDPFADTEDPFAGGETEEAIEKFLLEDGTTKPMIIRAINIPTKMERKRLARKRSLQFLDFVCETAAKRQRVDQTGEDEPCPVDVTMVAKEPASAETETQTTEMPNTESETPTATETAHVPETILKTEQKSQ